MLNQTYFNIIVIGLILYLFFKNNTLEKMTATPDIRAAVKEVYKADVQAIKNLGDFASTFMSADKKELTLPFDKVNINGVLNMGGNIALNDKEIRFRGANDGNHYMKWNQANDGPLIKGYAGVKVISPLSVNGDLRVTDDGKNGVVHLGIGGRGSDASRGFVDLRNSAGNTSFWQEGTNLYVYTKDQANRVFLQGHLTVNNDLEVKGTQFTMPTQGLRIASGAGNTHIQTQRDGGFIFEKWGGDWNRLPIYPGTIHATGDVNASGSSTIAGNLQVNGKINANGNVEGHVLTFRSNMCNKNNRCFTTTADFNRNSGAHNELQHHSSNNW